jgi:hypothetical protein
MGRTLAAEERGGKVSGSFGGGKGGSAQGLTSGGRGQASDTAGQLTRELAQRQHVVMWMDEIRVDGSSSSSETERRARQKRSWSFGERLEHGQDKGTPGRCRNDIAIAVVPYNRCLFRQ